MDETSANPVPAGNELVIRVREEFRAAVRALPPLRSATRLLLGCSAGGDSMALLDLAAELSQRGSWSLGVAHFDHAQRAGSETEARFVAARCASLDVPFFSERLTAVPDASGEAGDAASGLNESRLRDARFDFFARVMSRTRSDVLLLAHQADDRAETVLMRLMRGSGPTGLAGIRPVEEVRGITVARPLLSFRRETLRDYLRAGSLSWIDDPSNLDDRFKRVWVRRELLPLMERRMGIDVVPRLVRTGELADEESRALAAACDLMLDAMVWPADPPAISQLRLDHDFWRAAAGPLKKALLRQWIWKVRAGGHPPGFEALQEIFKFAERSAPGVLLRTVELIHLEKTASSLVAWPPGTRPARDALPPPE